MMLLDTLIENTAGIPVTEVITGAYVTMVTSRNTSICATLREEFCVSKGVRDAGCLTDLDSRSLAKFSLSDNLLEASIGVCALNSAINIDNLPFKNINAKDLIFEKGRGKKLAMIGHFPFIDNARNLFSEVFVFEKKPQPGDLCENDIPEFLPLADIVAITGMTVTNHTIDGILPHIRKDALVIMLGPSTPLSPILFDFGVDVIAGSVVRDSDFVRSRVIEGASLHYLGGIEYVALLKEEYNG